MPWFVAFGDSGLVHEYKFLDEDMIEFHVYDDDRHIKIEGVLGEKAYVSLVWLLESGRDIKFRENVNSEYERRRQ